MTFWSKTNTFLTPQRWLDPYPLHPEVARRAVANAQTVHWLRIRPCSRPDARAFRQHYYTKRKGDPWIPLPFSSAGLLAGYRHATAYGQIAPKAPSTSNTSSMLTTPLPSASPLHGIVTGKQKVSLHTEPSSPAAVTVRQTR